MERKNTLLLTVIAVATLLVAVVGATFAYFTASTSGGTASDVQVTTRSIDIVSTTATDLILDVTANDMLLANGTEEGVAKTGSSTLTMSTETGSSGGTSVCTYDLVYTVSNEFTNSSTNTTNKIEFSLTGATSTASTVGSPTLTSSVPSFSEVDMNGHADAEKVTLVDNATFTVDGGSNATAGNLIWTITASFKNYNFDQTELAGNVYGGSVNFENISCVNS